MMDRCDPLFRFELLQGHPLLLFRRTRRFRAAGAPPQCSEHANSFRTENDS